MILEMRVQPREESLPGGKRTRGLARQGREGSLPHEQEMSVSGPYQTIGESELHYYATAQ